MTATEMAITANMAMGTAMVLNMFFRPIVCGYEAFALLFPFD